MFRSDGFDMSGGADEIFLVRHGRSAHAWPRSRLAAAGFRAWIDEYNRTSLDPASHPPADLVALAAKMPHVVCSDLPRASASAERLCAAPHASALFREAGRPLRGRWSGLKLPLAAWDRISVVLWRLRCSRTDEPLPAARTRARRAAGELAGLAERFGRVLLVGHGTFNAMVAAELRRLGWTGPARSDDAHWGCTTYRRTRTSLRRPTAALPSAITTAPAP